MVGPNVARCHGSTVGIDVSKSYTWATPNSSPSCPNSTAFSTSAATIRISIPSSTPYRVAGTPNTTATTRTTTIPPLHTSSAAAARANADSITANVNANAASTSASGMDASAAAGANRAASATADPDIDAAASHVDADAGARSAAGARAAAAGSASSATEPTTDAHAAMADAHAETTAASLPAAAGSDGEGLAVVDGGVLVIGEKPCMGEREEEEEARYGSAGTRKILRRDSAAPNGPGQQQQIPPVQNSDGHAPRPLASGGSSRSSAPPPQPNALPPPPPRPAPEGKGLHVALSSHVPRSHSPADDPLDFSAVAGVFFPLRRRATKRKRAASPEFVDVRAAADKRAGGAAEGGEKAPAAKKVASYQQAVDDLAGNGELAGKQ
ncbi:hypothetical protein HU200_022555 [Digitaria exilis]|uniref:Uncharacterized protein n=1 Tax=Digitaria exilis TaxID=1010633 RepID=A0A835C1B2_9POAL|nr:hypothetical protein HU200_022555 [Digitaria exilis]